MFPDYYAILGVKHSVSQEEIKQAFRALALQYHPDVMPDNPTANEDFRHIYEAYQVLSSVEMRREYDQMQAQNYKGASNGRSQAKRPGGAAPPGNSAITIVTPSLELNCTLSQKQAPVYHEERLLYLLSELIPVANGALMETLPLNLCLAIDRSSSMRGEKLRAIKNALRSLIARLQPDDILSVVAFDNRAEVVVRAEAQQLPEVLIGSIERLMERGGTKISMGLEAALEEVERFARQPTVSHIILLTDGETLADEERCLELALKAHEQSMSITALGIGTEWNDALLDQIAAISDGSADYLASSNDIFAALAYRVDVLRKTLATNVKLSVALEGDVRLRRVTRVIPDISELMDAAPADQHWMMTRDAQLDLGNVAASAQDCALALLWEIILPANVSGHYILGQIEAKYDIPSAKLLDQRRSERLAIDFVEMMPSSSQVIPSRVKEAIEYVTAYRIQNKARDLAQQGDHKGASKLLHTASLRLRAVAQDDLAKEAQAQAQQLLKRQVPDRAAALKLKYGTKHLRTHQRQP